MCVYIYVLGGNDKRSFLNIEFWARWAYPGYQTDLGVSIDLVRIPEKLDFSGDWKDWMGKFRPGLDELEIIRRRNLLALSGKSGHHSEWLISVMAHSAEGGSASADVLVACSLSSYGVAMYSGNQEKLQVRVQLAYCMQMRQRCTSELDLISSPLHPSLFSLSYTLPGICVCMDKGWFPSFSLEVQEGKGRCDGKKIREMTVSLHSPHEITFAMHIMCRWYMQLRLREQGFSDEVSRWCAAKRVWAPCLGPSLVGQPRLTGSDFEVEKHHRPSWGLLALWILSVYCQLLTGIFLSFL